MQIDLGEIQLKDAGAGKTKIHSHLSLQQKIMTHWVMQWWANAFFPSCFMQYV